MNLGELQKKHNPNPAPRPLPQSTALPTSEAVEPLVPASHEYQDGKNQAFQSPQPIVATAKVEEAPDILPEYEPLLHEQLTKKKHSKLVGVVFVSVLAAFVALGVVVYGQQHPELSKAAAPAKAVTQSGGKKPTFAYYQPKKASAMKRESSDTAYDEQFGILSFKVILPDSEVILLSEQKEPANFAASSIAFDDMLAKIGTFKTLDVGIGKARIILSKTSTTNGPTVAYNSGGLLIFGRATQSLTPEDWKTFLGGLELVQP